MTFLSSQNLATESARDYTTHRVTILSLRFQQSKMQKCLQNVLLIVYEINGGFNLYNIFHLDKYSIELAKRNCKCNMRYNLVLLKVTILSTSKQRISL